MSEAVADGPAGADAAFLDASTAAAQQSASLAVAATPAAATAAPPSPQPSTGRFIIKPRQHARPSPPSQTETLAQRPSEITVENSAVRDAVASPSGGSATAAAAATAAATLPPSPSNSARPASPDDDADGGSFANMSTVVVRPPTPPSKWNRNPSPPASRRFSDTADKDGDTMSLSAMPAPVFNPNSSLLPPSKPIFQQGLSFDVSGSEFSAALRAALSEAGAPGTSTLRGKRGPRPGTRGSGGPSPATSMFDASGLVPAGSGVMIAAADGSAVAAESASSSAAGQAASDESTERELRKQAIRQKNAMHMRIRNASVSQASAMSAGRTPRGAGGGAAAAAGNPRESKENHLAVDTGLGSGRGLNSMRRSATMHTPRSTELNVEMQSLSPDAPSPTNAAASRPSSLAAFLMGTSLPQPHSAGPAEQAQTKRTLSSILKPTAHVAQHTLQTPSHSHVQSSPKRQQSGILRMPSLRSNRGSLISPSNAESSTPTAAGAGALGVQRSATANSRMGFDVPEGGDTDRSSSVSSGDSDGEENAAAGGGGGGGGGGGAAGGNGDSAADDSTRPPANAGGGQGSVKSRKGAAIAFVDTPTVMEDHGASEAGDSQYYEEDDEDGLDGDGTSSGPRKKFFARDGSRLVLRSVSHQTAASMGHGHQAASVMVASVSSIFTRLRLYTDLCFVMATIGVVLTVLNKELHYAYPLNSRDGPDAAVYWAIVIVRSLSSLSTILLIYYLYKYHQADFQFLQLNRVYLLRSAFWNTQLAWSFALEVLCCVVHEPPFLNHDVDLSITDAGTRILLDGGYAYSGPIVVRNPWSLLIALRFYVFLRLILSRYYTGGTKILGLWFNFNFNIPFAIRNMLYSHPLLSLAPVVCMLICSCSYSLWVFEREVPERHFSFGTALWVVLITITSVGYGDIAPLSSGGRAICILAAFIGILVSAVLVAAVHQKLTLLPYEGRMVEFLERDSNSTSLKFHAARCIARSWRYYRWRKRCIRLLARGRFTFLARANLLRHKSVMLQAVFDFQSARKQIQAYDRRYHSEQLFRSMLEGLYDKLESMTLDMHVLEDELDLSYEEQRRMAQRQSELIDEVRLARGVKPALNGMDATPASAGAAGAAGAAGSASTSGGSSTDAPAASPPEHGRISLLRGPSVPSSGTPLGSSSPSPSPDPTRPSSSAEHASQQQGAPSGRSSGATTDYSVEASVRQYKNGHKSMRNSELSPEEIRAAEASAQAAAAAAAVAAQPLASVPDTSVNSNRSNRSDKSTGSAHRSSTLGTLDLVAAAAAVAAAHQQQQQQTQPQQLQPAPGALSSAVTQSPRGPSMRAHSTNDLLSVTVEAPRSADNVIPGTMSAYLHSSAAQAHPTSSLVLRTGNRRTTLIKQESLPVPTSSHNVTSDLLSVVETIGSEMPPTPAGRIRFGEADFAAHRAAPVRSGRGTITLQRGKTVDRGSMISNATMHGGVSGGAGIGGSGGGGSDFYVAQAMSQRMGVPRPGSIELPGTTFMHAHAGEVGTPGDALPLRPAMTRMSSTGGILRGLATSRASVAAAANANINAGAGSGGGGGGVSSEQFERMMQMLAGVSERLGGVEAQMDRERRAGSSLRRAVHQPTSPGQQHAPHHASSHSIQLASSVHAASSQLPAQSPQFVTSQSHI